MIGSTRSTLRFCSSELAAIVALVLGLSGQPHLACAVEDFVPPEDDNSNWASDPLMTAAVVPSLSDSESTHFVHIGQMIVFVVDAKDEDTHTVGEGGTVTKSTDSSTTVWLQGVAGSYTPPEFATFQTKAVRAKNATLSTSINIPNQANLVGKTFTVDAMGGNWRAASGDNRYDADGRFKRMNFFIIDTCPTTLTQTGIINKVADNDIPADKTKFAWLAVMQVGGGNPPVGGLDWNGLVITELVDDPVWNPANSNAYNPNLVTGSFTVATKGDVNNQNPAPNRFWDQFAGEGNVILKNGFDEATATQLQKYVCSVGGTKWCFNIETTFTRLSNNRIKGVVNHPSVTCP